MWVARGRVDLPGPRRDQVGHGLPRHARDADGRARHPASVTSPAIVAQIAVATAIFMVGRGALRRASPRGGPLLCLPVAVLTGAGVRRADLRVLGEAGERRRLQHPVPVRDHPAVPVLRHVLPDRRSCPRCCGRSPGSPRCGTVSTLVPRRWRWARPAVRVGGHLRYLLAFVVAGGWLALRTFTREAGRVTRPSRRLRRPPGRAWRRHGVVAGSCRCPAGAGMARILVERNVMAFRHGWIAIVTGFAEPVFYLFSLGHRPRRAGAHRDDRRRAVVPYAAFVAPALLASSAMNGAVFDSTFNVFFKLKYAKLYDAVLATPARAARRGGGRDRAGRCCAAPSTPRRSSWSPGSPGRCTPGGRCWRVPAAMFIGFAFAARRACSRPRSCARGSDFDYVTLAIQPMFLFSATFFPLSTYPGPLQWLVQVTPLYHGVGARAGADARRGRPRPAGAPAATSPRWGSSGSWARPGGSSGCSCPDPAPACRRHGVQHLERVFGSLCTGSSPVAHRAQIPVWWRVACRWALLTSDPTTRSG